MNELEKQGLPTAEPSSANKKAPVKRRDIDFFNEISGPNAARRTKALVNLRWFEKNSDATETEVREVNMQKPIVQIVKTGGYVFLFLDFMRRTDVDLQNAWSLMMDFYNPANSVSYTEEELETGVFNPGGGSPDKLVYFPLLQVRISPLGHESEYLIVGLNPMGFSLCARDPSGDPCMLQMVFDDDFFIVISEDLEEVDLEAMKSELLEEMQADENQNYMNLL